jgi:hypothetical protein
MADKPKIFVSSTIYDFRDLRTALKFWLEELGFEVYLSEQNDFPVQSDLNSYETCIQAINDCDYFILLVGGRVGGWYDKDKRVSITQAEYHHAYSRLGNGQIKILAFVRQDIWDVREDRKELEQVLKQEALRNAELDEAAIDRIAKHPSKFANDADFTFAFLHDIARNEEMKAAMAGTVAFPIGNWIRQFSGFGDIIDALRVEFRIGASLSQIALTANLCKEIEANLRVLMDQSDGNANPKYKWANFAREQLSGGINDSSQITAKHLKWLGIFGLNGCGLGRKLSTTALDEAITSGAFLEFDQSADAFVVGQLHDSMLEMKRNIERLCHNDELLNVASRITLAEQFSSLDGDSRETVRNLSLVPVFAIHDTQFNVVSLLKAVYRALNGDSSFLESVHLYGDSPLSNENATMQRERPTPDQIERWLNE